MIPGLVLVVAGTATHLGLFNRGEHHLYGLRYLQIFFCASCIAVWIVTKSGDVTIRQGGTWVTQNASLFLAGLYGSLVIYRIFFHPLKCFPGPFIFKLSSLSFSTRLLGLDAHRKVLALHHQYGDFVRIGSSDLSIAHPKAPEAIYGRKSKCSKSDWYDLTLPMTSMQTTRKRAEHDQRRRVWGSAFSDTALKHYEGRTTVYQDQLITRILASKGSPIDATELCHQFGFDVMGDLSFGESFHMLTENGNHWAIKLLRRGMAPLGLMFPAWCFRLLLSVPGATGDWFAFKDYCCQLLDKRLATRPATQTITSFLIQPWLEKKPAGHDLNMLQGDSQLIIVAGSDTTAATLTSIFYELARQPNLICRARLELQQLVASGKDLSNQSLQTLDLLNGIINETLRLHPPAGLALQRKTPPEGLLIDGTYIPGDITVWCPQYVIGRNENAYKDASLFYPQRWYVKPEMIKEPMAYAPFSLGTYNCIGKSLALGILRTTVARILLEFDIGFAGPDNDGAAFVEEAKTQFNTLPGSLLLKFYPVRKTEFTMPS